MSTEDPVLQKIGTDLLHGFVAVTGETAFLTVYAVLVVKLGCAMMTKERRQRKPHILMTAISILFFLALAMWALDVANLVIELNTTLVQGGGGLTIANKLNKSLALVYRLTAAQDALYSYMTLLGDAIIVSRVWTLRAYHRRWVFWIPCACLLGSLAATLMLTYCVAVTGGGIVLGSFERPAFCKHAQTVTYIIPCLTTAIVTLLIGITTWKYRSAMKNLRNNVNTPGSHTTTRSRRRNQVEKILILLIESGLCYFLFFLAQATESPQLHKWVQEQTNLSFSALFQFSTSVIVGIYPTIVLLLAHSKHTVVDSLSEDNRSSETSASTPIEPITFRVHHHATVTVLGDEEIELESGNTALR
ncbi:hypothetical protein FB45DRAFT_931074 [Roridomyces roridus]|uniref:Uncharacterized protein n=1 Tax=Roridomyces roridus TaxID=1738132 RepID=A0AAD7BFP2_9AGAR|nr:hypothetical protein FB45DRAFT_931074 [Roridomyces roridus]